MCVNVHISIYVGVCTCSCVYRCVCVCLLVMLATPPEGIDLVILNAGPALTSYAKVCVCGRGGGGDCLHMEFQAGKHLEFQVTG